MSDAVKAGSGVELRWRRCPVGRAGNVLFTVKHIYVLACFMFASTALTPCCPSRIPSSDDYQAAIRHHVRKCVGHRAAVRLGPVWVDAVGIAAACCHLLLTHMSAKQGQACHEVHRCGASFVVYAIRGVTCMKVNIWQVLCVTAGAPVQMNGPTWRDARLAR